MTEGKGILIAFCWIVRGRLNFDNVFVPTEKMLTRAEMWEICAPFTGMKANEHKILSVSWLSFDDARTIGFRFKGE